jgi:hypothetical protein
MAGTDLAFERINIQILFTFLQNHSPEVTLNNGMAMNQPMSSGQLIGGPRGP